MFTCSCSFIEQTSEEIYFRQERSKGISMHSLHRAAFMAAIHCLTNLSSFKMLKSCGG